MCLHHPLALAVLFPLGIFLHGAMGRSVGLGLNQDWSDPRIVDQTAWSSQEGQCQPPAPAAGPSLHLSGWSRTWCC